MVRWIGRERNPFLAAASFVFMMGVMVLETIYLLKVPSALLGSVILFYVGAYLVIFTGMGIAFFVWRETHKREDE